MMKHPSQKIACNQINYPLHPPWCPSLLHETPYSPLWAPISPLLSPPRPSGPEEVDRRPKSSSKNCETQTLWLWKTHFIALYLLTSIQSINWKMEWKLSLTLGTKWIRDDPVSSVSVVYALKDIRWPRKHTHIWKICWIVVLATHGNEDVIWVT